MLRWAKVSRTGLDMMHSGGTGGRGKIGRANQGVSDSRGRDRRLGAERVINRADVNRDASLNHACKIIF